MDLYQRIADRTGLDRSEVKHRVYWALYGGGIIQPHQTYQEVEDKLVKYLGGK